MEQIYLENLEQSIPNFNQFITSKLTSSNVSLSNLDMSSLESINEQIGNSKLVISITGDEHTHLKALRTKVGQNVLVTNGKGLSAICQTIEFSKHHHSLEIKELLLNYNELKTKISLCLGILDNKDRLEFAIEKATELGISEIILLETHFSEKAKIKTERLNSKLIAAIKQSKRSILPKLEIIPFVEMLNDLKAKSHKETLFLLTDINSQYFNLEERVKNSKNIVIFVGPEGGFSEKEIEEIKDLGNSFNNFHILKLSNSRLRAETAALSSVSVVTSYLV